ncbi:MULTISPECIES: sialidase family protein [Paenibacillus]|jgi:hypothetical protein|uniref:sialidase family protein n=1 Tax=Paenibacillus TaxID=44249 RepID=UPI00073E4768|nr:MULTISPECIES: hypothetical protein [Paenibacillus]MDU4694431.1 hypothetical protein [Paenibacillus sp.]
MKRKSTLAWVVCLSLVLSFWVQPGSRVEASDAYPTIDSITLQESPISMGEGWTLNTTFSSNAPYSMIQGKNNEYLAVGPYGTVMKSANGVNWAALSKFGNYHLTAVAWDGSKYVMFGNNTEYAMNLYSRPAEGFISTDGLTWTKIDFDPGETIYQLEWGQAGFVAVGQKHIFYSKDGENWSTSRSLFNDYGADILRVVNGNYFISSRYDSQFVLVSKDGQNWSAKTYNASAAIQDLIWTGKHYLGVGNGIYTSADGVNWTKQAKSPTGIELKTIVKGHNMYIVTGASATTEGIDKNVAYTSKDGATWTKVDLSSLQANIYTLYPVKSGFAGIASNNMQGHADGTYSIYTTDGKTWSYRLIGTSLGGDFNAIATNGKRTVAVGLSGSVVYTDDGKTWRSSNPFSYKSKIGRAHLFDVVWGGNKFVAAGNGGIYYSADGSSWKQAKVPFSDQYGGLRNILWTGKFYVASDQVYGVYTSKDGLTWKRVASVSNNWLTSMVYDGKRLVAAFRVHNYNTGVGTTKIMQTTDGTNWKLLKTLDMDEAFLAWTSSGYVAINQYNPSKVWVSKDGSNWSKKSTNLTASQNIHFLTTMDGQFFAMSQVHEESGEDVTYSDRYIVSKDGVNWQSYSLPDKHPGVNIFGTETMEDGIKAHGKYIFVGTYGEIMTTDQLASSK